MRKCLLAGVAAAALFAATLSGPAYAIDVVTCTNCSTITQQIADYARQLTQLEQEIQTAQNTLESYINLVQNTVSLPSTVYRDLTGDISQIMGIAQQANMLTGQTGQMLANLGAGASYPWGSSVTNWHQQLTTENNAIATAITAAANVLNLQPGQLASDSSTLAALENQATSATGRQMTLQTIAGAVAAIGQAIQKSQGTVTTAQQAMMTATTAKRDRDAMLQAVNDADLGATLQSQCSAISSLGGTQPAGCSSGLLKTAAASSPADQNYSAGLTAQEPGITVTSDDAGSPVADQDFSDGAAAGANGDQDYSTSQPILGVIAAPGQ